MAQALWMRLRDVAWSDYSTSEGNGERIPRLLQDISSRKNSRAIKASHILWRTLCSDTIRSAAEPTTPFLIELLQQAQAEVQFEIIDILKSFSIKLAPLDNKSDWQQATWNSMAKSLPILRKLHRSGSADLKISLEQLIELLQTNSIEK